MVERVLKWPKGRRSEVNMQVLVLVKATEASEGAGPPDPALEARVLARVTRRQRFRIGVVSLSAVAGFAFAHVRLSGAKPRRLLFSQSRPGVSPAS